MTVEDRRRQAITSPWSDEAVVDIVKKAMEEGKIGWGKRTEGSWSSLHDLFGFDLTVLVERPIVFELFDRQGNITEVGQWMKRKRHEAMAKLSSSLLPSASGTCDSRAGRFSANAIFCQLGSRSASATMDQSYSHHTSNSRFRERDSQPEHAGGSNFYPTGDAHKDPSGSSTGISTPREVEELGPSKPPRKGASERLEQLRSEVGNFLNDLYRKSFKSV